MNKPQSFIDKNRADTLLEKWAPVLDYSSDSVKSIEDDTTRLNTAILLENQEKWCIEEANQSGNPDTVGLSVVVHPLVGFIAPLAILTLTIVVMLTAMRVYLRYLFL
jgi:hypothetical protein